MMRPDLWQEADDCMTWLERWAATALLLLLFLVAWLWQMVDGDS